MQHRLRNVILVMGERNFHCPLLLCARCKNFLPRRASRLLRREMLFFCDLLHGTGIEIERNIIFPAQIFCKCRIPPGFRAAQVMVYVDSQQRKAKRLLQFPQQMKQADGIRAAGEAEQHAFACRYHMILFHKGSYFLSHPSFLLLFFQILATRTVISSCAAAAEAQHAFQKLPGKFPRLAVFHFEKKLLHLLRPVPGQRVQHSVRHHHKVITVVQLFRCGIKIRLGNETCGKTGRLHNLHPRIPPKERRDAPPFKKLQTPV